jgi:3-deoxy-7-phosphoheptulonate synthase
MVVKLMPNIKERQIRQIENEIKNAGLKSRRAFGKEDKLLCIIGDESKYPIKSLESFPFVEYVHPVQHSDYKLVSRFSRPEYKNNTKCKVVTVGNIEIGNGNYVKIAGPCAVQNKKHTLEIARKLNDSGLIDIFRGGAYKPRSSAYSFQGLEEKGLEILAEVKSKTGLPIITEITSPTHLDLFKQYDIDILQIGAISMRSFQLLKEYAEFAKNNHKAIMLKNLPELKSYKQILACAEYIALSGCFDIIFCERGNNISTGDFRNVPNAGIIHDLRKYSYFPIVVDPSHACGIQDLVFNTLDLYLSMKPHGHMIEVKRNNEKIVDEFGTEVCDYKQSVTVNQYIEEIRKRKI